MSCTYGVETLSCSAAISGVLGMILLFCETSCGGTLWFVDTWEYLPDTSGVVVSYVEVLLHIS